MSKMFDNIEDYFRKFIPARNSIFFEIEREAINEQIPIIGPVVGNFLNILATTMGAKRILELGTATGYSTLYLAFSCEKTGGKVKTIEVNKALAKKANINIHKAIMQDYVEIIIGDARNILKELNETFDFIFIDVDKMHYMSLLEDCHRLLKKYGLIIFDNTGFKDTDQFNETIYNSKKWQIVNLLSFLPLHSPEKDGICLGLRL